MKTFVTIENEHFMKFLEVHRLANSPENFQRFLSEIGVTTISFTKPLEASIEVPAGSCIRLHTPETYKLSVQEKLKKQEQTETETETHPRTNSCSIQ